MAALMKSFRDEMSASLLFTILILGGMRWVAAELSRWQHLPCRGGTQKGTGVRSPILMAALAQYDFGGQFGE